MSFFYIILGCGSCLGPNDVNDCFSTLTQLCTSGLRHSGLEPHLDRYHRLAYPETKHLKEPQKARSSPSAGIPDQPGSSSQLPVPTPQGNTRTPSPVAAGFIFKCLPAFSSPCYPEPARARGPRKAFPDLPHYEKFLPWAHCLLHH